MLRQGQVSVTSTHVVSSEALQNDPQGGSPEKESMPLATASSINTGFLCNKDIPYLSDASCWVSTRIAFHTSSNLNEAIYERKIDIKTVNESIIRFQSTV
ncbi:hypothetical protein D5086_007931 [Populus alba]|uniref:Uncharacterized protein n=1 Tax=Populus alba TaxID=43335 RepID=A0ACC4CDW9_POPAL